MKWKGIKESLISDKQLLISEIGLLSFVFCLSVRFESMNLWEEVFFACWESKSELTAWLCGMEA